MSNIVAKARDYAIECHRNANHKYAEIYDYSFHLGMVHHYADKYKHLLLEEYRNYALAGAWVHDCIEDARQTFNDVKKATNDFVAEIAYALTNEKGRTRKERASEKYYQGIMDNEIFTFVKICDRLANVKFSTMNNSSMVEVYRKEHEQFKNYLFMDKFSSMFDELETLLDIKESQ